MEPFPQVHLERGKKEISKSVQFSTLGKALPFSANDSVDNAL